MHSPFPHILLVAHGSPSPAAVVQTKAFCEAFSARISQPASLCFLELNEPGLEEGLRNAAALAGVGGQVAVLPLFLGAASHQKNDLPVALSWARQEYPQVAFSFAAPLAPHANLVSLLEVRIQEALAEVEGALPTAESGVLLVGRGSSDPDSNSELARSARLLFENRPYQTVEFAYQAVAHPNIAEGVTRVARLGARQLIVAPNLLFTGAVEEDIIARASETAREFNLPVIFSKPLGIHPLLLEVVQVRLEQSLAGAVQMSCDLCKYRLPMAGYEHQTGQPQSSHHFQPGGHTH